MAGRRLAASSLPEPASEPTATTAPAATVVGPPVAWAEAVLLGLGGVHQAESLVLIASIHTRGLLFASPVNRGTVGQNLRQTSKAQPDSTLHRIRGTAVVVYLSFQQSIFGNQHDEDETEAANFRTTGTEKDPHSSEWVRTQRCHCWLVPIVRNGTGGPKGAPYRPTMP